MKPPIREVRASDDQGFDDFIRGGFVGSDGTLHARTRVGGIVHLQGFGDAVPAALPAFGPSHASLSRLSEWLPLSQGRKNR